MRNLETMSDAELRALLRNQQARIEGKFRRMEAHEEAGSAPTDKDYNWLEVMEAREAETLAELLRRGLGERKQAG